MRNSFAGLAPRHYRPRPSKHDGPDTRQDTGAALGETLNKSILDFSAPAIKKVRFSNGSQNQWLAATDFGSASLRCGKR